MPQRQGWLFGDIWLDAADVDLVDPWDEPSADEIASPPLLSDPRQLTLPL